MIVETMPVGLLECNCTILGDEQSGEAIVVDPGMEIPKIVAAVQRNGLRVKQIVVTHAHIDHIAGAMQLKRLTGAPIVYNQADLPLVAMMDAQAEWLAMKTPEVPPPDVSPEDGAKVQVEGIDATIVLTPGHTQGSLCLYVPGEALLLAGDTLFAGTVGRTDLPGGNSRQIVDSIQGKLMQLPETTLVIPGHGQTTTIGRERATNPFLQR